MPCPVKSIVTLTLDRSLPSSGSTVTLTAARIGPSTPPVTPGGGRADVGDFGGHGTLGEPYPSGGEVLVPDRWGTVALHAPIYDAVLPFHEPGRIGDVGEDFCGWAVHLDTGRC